MPDTIDLINHTIIGLSSALIVMTVVDWAIDRVLGLFSRW